MPLAIQGRSVPTTPEQGAEFWRALPHSAVAALYISGVQKAVRENLFLFFGAGTGALLSDSFGLREAGLVGGGVLLIGLLVTLVYHRRFRFLLLDDAIRVRKGLFEQTELKVRFERVQNVAFSQPLYLKPIGLTRVKLETPGAAQTEVELPGIPTSDAVELRQWIAGAQARVRQEAQVDEGDPDRPQDAAGDADDVPQHEVFAVAAGDLFRYGMTSNQLWLVLGVIGGPLAERIADHVGDMVDWLEGAGLIESDALSGAPLLAGLLVLTAIGLFLMLGLALSGLIAVVRFHRFRLFGDRERLHAGYGLLDKREKALKRSKLHAIELIQTAFGRLLDRWHVVCHQAALDALNPINQDKRFLIPGIRTDRVDGVLSELADRDWSEPDFEGIDPRFRRFYWQRVVLLPLLILLGLEFCLLENPLWSPIALGVGALLLAYLIHLRWKRWGLHSDDNGLQVRQGLIGTRILLFDDARCQQVKMTTSPFQRRHGLATLTLRLPHGEVSIPFLPEQRAADLANRLLRVIETSTEHAL
jgi:putative membrane protein